MIVNARIETESRLGLLRRRRRLPCFAAQLRRGSLAPWQGGAGEWPDVLLFGPDLRFGIAGRTSACARCVLRHGPWLKLQEQGMGAQQRKEFPAFFFILSRVSAQHLVWDDRAVRQARLQGSAMAEKAGQGVAVSAQLLPPWRGTRE